MMKRNMDLIRKIMMECSTSEDAGILIYRRQPIIDGYGKDRVLYHILLLKQAGFAVRATNPYCVELTWEGHNFLDMIKDEGVWEKTKLICDRAGIGVTPRTIEHYHDYVVANSTATTLVQIRYGG